jgi:hypothetical protein
MESLSDVLPEGHSQVRSARFETPINEQALLCINSKSFVLQITSFITQTFECGELYRIAEVGTIDETCRIIVLALCSMNAVGSVIENNPCREDALITFPLSFTRR